MSLSVINRSVFVNAFYKRVIEKHEDQLELVRWNHEMSFMDIDDQEDYDLVKLLN